MKLIVFFWFGLVLVNYVICAPGLYHENIEDGKKNVVKRTAKHTVTHDITNDKRNDNVRQLTDTLHSHLTSNIKKTHYQKRHKKDKIAHRNQFNRTAVTKNSIVHKLNDTSITNPVNFTKDENIKKADVFLIDSSNIGEDGVVRSKFGQRPSQVGDIMSPDDSAIIGDKKENIISKANSDSANIEGSNPDMFEQDLTLKSNELTGNVMPIQSNAGNFKTLDAAALQSNIPAEIEYLKGEESSSKQIQDPGNPRFEKPPVGEAETKSAIDNSRPTEKVMDSLLEPIEQPTGKYSPTNFMNTASAVKSDPAVSKAINADNIIDSSIKEAITAQLKDDVDLATGKTRIESATSEYGDEVPVDAKLFHQNKEDLKNASLVGDIANVAEVADKAVLSRPRNKHLKRKYLKPKHAAQTKIHQVHEAQAINLQSSEPLSSMLDINTRESALTRTEQNLISSIDRAARRKDTANEVATRIMMPIKTDAFSEQTIAPSEQLLDMLSHGKFREPLPESVLDKLASMDPNQAIVQEEAAATAYRPTKAARDRGGLMQVGSEVLPVRRIAVKTPKATAKPMINPKEMAKAEQMMKTNPYYLAQNNMLLDASKYNNLQDLSSIGESIFPNNVIDLKQPMLFNGGANAGDTTGTIAGESGGSIYSNTDGSLAAQSSQPTGLINNAAAKITGTIVGESGGSIYRNTDGSLAAQYSQRTGVINNAAARNTGESTGTIAGESGGSIYSNTDGSLASQSSQPTGLINNAAARNTGEGTGTIAGEYGGSIYSNTEGSLAAKSSQTTGVINNAALKNLVGKETADTRTKLNLGANLLGGNYKNTEAISPLIGGNYQSTEAVSPTIRQTVNNVECRDCQHDNRPMASPTVHQFQQFQQFQQRPVKLHHQESHYVENDIDPLVMKQISQLPTVSMTKVLQMHRKNHKTSGSFKQTLVDTSINRNSEDEFVPEQMVRLPEEHINHGYAVCKYGPCLNGGTCTAHPEKYYCSCLPGWIGSNCEKRNSCFPNPCHYGTCSPNIDGFTCTCKMGFKGNLCNVLDRCHPNPCHSNGLCTETYHGVMCECAPGFKGKLCEMESKCDPINPCLNGGLCREFVDHYRCSCAESFRGQNCEAYISPTRAPPTVPMKQVGPQVIPAPVNAPNTDTHDVYTYHSYDAFGSPFSAETVLSRVSSEGLVNPGASLVPHPIIMKGSHSEPGNPFVGAPTLPSHDGVIVHHSGEEEKYVASSATSSSEDEVTTLPEGTKDDRYQTHMVEVDKDEEGKSMKHPPHGHSNHVGDSISMEYTSSNPSPNNDAEADKVLKENKEHLQEVKENTHQHQHDEHATNEKHLPQNTVDHHNLHLPENHHLINAGSDGRSVVVEEQASERSTLLNKPSFKQETGTTRSVVTDATVNKDGNPISDEEDVKKNMQTITDLLKMFDKATKTLSSKIVKNSNKYLIQQGKQPFNPKSVKTDGSASRDEQPTGAPTQKLNPNFIPAIPADANTEQITKYIRNLYNLTSAITNNLARSANVLGAKKDELVQQQNYKNFTDHQKHAYKTWRRQALINFHVRNPNKPMPKNTVSLSKNSLCPKFCRLFCDPWCVKMGCCKLSQEKLNIYKEIERAQEKRSKGNKRGKELTLDSNDDNYAATNDDTVVTELENPSVTTNNPARTLQNPTKPSQNPTSRSLVTECGKCNENADCVDKKCKCKLGFNGDGETCTVDTCMLCHADAHCEHDRCLCKAGYFGDGYNCNPIVSKRHLCSRCHKMAKCVTGNCVCSTGFYGNGKQCWPIPIL